MFVNIHPHELSSRWLVRPDDPLAFHSREVYLEITESAAFTYFELCMDVLKEVCRRTGAHLVVDDYGVTSPMLLYYGHRKGWSFGVEDLSPQLIENLKRHGARYFVTTTWSAIERDNRDTATYLGLFPKVELSDAPRDMMVFNVERPAGE